MELPGQRLNIENNLQSLINDCLSGQSAEDKLLQSQSHLLASQKIGNIGSWELAVEKAEDIIFKVNYLSDQTYRILGFEPKEVAISREFYVSRVHPDDRDRIIQSLKNSINTKSKYQVEYRIIQKNGAIRCVKSSAEAIYNAYGVPYKMIGTVLDITDIKKSQEDLRKSEANFRTIFDNTDIGYILLDTDFNVMSFNHISKFYIQTITEKEIKNDQNFIDLLPLQLSADIQKIFNDVLKGKTVQLEANYSTQKGDLWYFVKYFPISNKEGNIFGVLLSINDITEKKNSQEKLRQSESHLLASQRIGNVGSWEITLAGTDPVTLGKIYWSDQTYRLFGYSPYEVEVSTDFFLNRVHPADRENVRNAMRESIISGKHYLCEHRIIKKDGEVRIIQNKAEIIKDTYSGKPLKMIGASQDVTEIKQAEEALLKSKANLSTIVNNSDRAYLLLNDNLEIVDYNEPAKKLWKKDLGKDIELGHNAIDYYTGERKSRLIENCKQVFQGKKISYDSNFADADGNLHWHSHFLSPVFGKNNTVLGMIIARADITEWKKAELEREKITEDLIQRNKDLEQFAYIISHNLRAPVANIIGSTSLISDNNLSDEERAFLLDGLLSSSQKLDEVIFDLNEILHIKKAINEKREKVLFSEILNDILSSIEELVVINKVTVYSNFSACNELNSIRSYIFSIFYNLITNSIKYKKPGVDPVIEINSLIDNDRVILIFKDNGTGIDMDKYGSQLFGLYKRFHLHIEGKGIGLFMVKTQVETLGGKIKLQSSENNGCTFELEFRL